MFLHALIRIHFSAAEFGLESLHGNSQQIRKNISLSLFYSSISEAFRFPGFIRSTVVGPNISSRATVGANIKQS